MLYENKRPLKYYGVLRPDQKDMVAKLHAKIYDYWDQSTHAPPKTRGREEETRPPPAFALLGWSEDRAVWPRAVLENFPEQSSQREELLKLKAEFDALVPALPSSTGASGSQGGASARAAARASGSPDFSLDDGKKPLDVKRLLDLPPVPLQELQARNDDRTESESCESFLLCSLIPKCMLRRLAHATGVRGRPSILVMKNFDIYIGNETTDPMNLEASELLGFNVGMFVEKLVEGLRTSQFSCFLRGM